MFAVDRWRVIDGLPTPALNHFYRKSPLPSFKASNKLTVAAAAMRLI